MGPITGGCSGGGGEREIENNAEKHRIALKFYEESALKAAILQYIQSS